MSNPINKTQLSKFNEAFIKEKLPNEIFGDKETWKLEKSRGTSVHWQNFKVFTMGRMIHLLFVITAL